jgi:hypothetical protein
MHRVIRNLNPQIAEYKGMTRYRQFIIDYLAPFDDGRVLNQGIAAEQSSL